MGKDAKGKIETSAKEVQDGKRAAEKQDQMPQFLSYLIQGYSNARDLQQLPRLSKAFGQTKNLCRFRAFRFWQGFFLSLRGLISVFSGPVFFAFFTQGLFKG